jgi:catechol 2,3-dioxygenase-like lactoylglutathione lyase family enzyme
MLDHIGFVVGDFEKSKAFYLQTLAPLNMAIVKEGEGWAMLGEAGRGSYKMLLSLNEFRENFLIHDGLNGLPNTL